MFTRSRVLIFLFILLGTFSYGQRINTMAELRTRKGTSDSFVIMLGNAELNDGSGDIFYWDNTSTITDNNITVIQSTGIAIGRWLRLKALNVKAGNFNTSAIALTTSYIVSHGLGVTPSQIIYTPTSPNAAALSYVSAKTATTFTITFLNVPVVGTNNISFDWIVRL